MSNEVDEFADFCQAAARKLRAENPTIKTVDVFSSIAFSLWREKVMPVRNGVIEECRQVALQCSAMLPCDDDFTRGYANGRLGAAADIERLKAAPNGGKGEGS